MKILEVKIHNYRNLDGVCIHFAEDCNFIVGENNVGKSNVLCLLNTIFSAYAFDEDDFHDQNTPICIELKIKLDELELGNFDDNCDPQNHQVINIICEQKSVDDEIKFRCKDTQQIIEKSKIRATNYIYYDSSRNPTTEINFDKSKGVGRFLKSLIMKYKDTIKSTATEENKNATNKSESNFIDTIVDTSKLIPLVDKIKETTSKIKPFQDFKISAAIDDNIENLLTKIITLKDGKGYDFAQSGRGIQFLVLIILVVLEKIYTITNKNNYKKYIYSDDSGKRFISLILALDEPEIHLHPYMQRSLIKYLNSIINNKNEDFNKLIKERFDIDGLIGQIIVVTHSPNIILNDYKQIIRIYFKNGITQAVSGKDINLGNSEKQLRYNFIYIKESFFCKCVVLTEGQSEYVNFPHFCFTLGIDIDDLGISVLYSGGGGSIDPIIEILKSFCINYVALKDKDENTSGDEKNGIYVTLKRDFEEEIISMFELQGNAGYHQLKEILDKFEMGIEPKHPNYKKKEKNFDKHGIHKTVAKYSKEVNEHKNDLSGGYTFDNIPETLRRYFLLHWLIKIKGSPFGELFTQDQIPDIYKTLLEEARKKASENV